MSKNNDDFGNIIFWLIMLSMFLGGGGVPFLTVTPYGWQIGLVMLVLMIIGMGKKDR